MEFNGEEFLACMDLLVSRAQDCGINELREADLRLCADYDDIPEFFCEIRVEDVLLLTKMVRWLADRLEESAFRGGAEEAIEQAYFVCSREKKGE